MANVDNATKVRPGKAFYPVVKRMFHGILKLSSNKQSRKPRVKISDTAETVLFYETSPQPGKLDQQFYEWETGKPGWRELCDQGISKEKIAQKMSNINSFSAPVSRNQNSHHTEQACVSMLTPVCSSLLPERPQNSEKVYMNNAKARMRSTEAEGSRGHGSLCQGRREKLSPVLKEDRWGGVRPGSCNCLE